MTKSPARHSSGHLARLRPSPTVWWFWPAALYVFFRGVNALMMIGADAYATAVSATETGTSAHFVSDAGSAPAGYLTAVTNWDGQWYWDIASDGYPTELPTGADGRVIQNSWAFCPLYPSIVRVVMTLTGFDFPIAATITSLTFGLAASLYLFRIVSAWSDRLGGLIAVALLNAFTSAPVLNMAYADSLALLLVLIAIRCLSAQRFVVTAGILVLLAFTRNIVGAMALTFVVLAVWRATKHRSLDRDARFLMLLAGWSALLTFAWPAVAAVVTGEPRAIFDTYAAWGPPDVAYGPFTVVSQAEALTNSRMTAWLLVGGWFALVAAFVTLRQPNIYLRAWSGCYAAYVILTTGFHPSGLRYFLLVVPCFWPLTLVAHSTRAVRLSVSVLLATAGLVSQWWWIRYAVTISAEQVLYP